MRLRAPGLARGLATGRTALLKDLRARTSAPMAKCVEALKATDDDVDSAIDWLRKAGLASAGKKAARGAHEGAIALAGTDTALALVEVNTETDFVARNELFHALCADIAASALGLGEAGARGDVDTAALGAESLPGRGPVADAVALAVSQLGENVVLRRATVLGESPRRHGCVQRSAASGRNARASPAGAQNGVVSSYVHNAYAPHIGQIGAGVALECGATPSDDARETLRDLGRKLAMHVVAASPLALSRAELGTERVQREREILAEQARSAAPIGRRSAVYLGHSSRQARASGKPDHLVEKMVEGRLNKFYKEAALLEQAYVVDDTAGSVQKASWDRVGIESSPRARGHGRGWNRLAPRR